MSYFEIAMLVCFGAAWPVSIYKSYTSRAVAGKSLMFLVIVFAGYVAGILHKVLYNLDFVVWFYVLNAAMVFADMVIYVRNYHMKRREMGGAADAA
jgi:hypothetical protein